MIKYACVWVELNETYSHNVRDNWSRQLYDDVTPLNEQLRTAAANLDESVMMRYMCVPACTDTSAAGES